jgi:hypothetical protein
MIAIVIISGILLYGYIIAVTILNGGTLPSISESWYLLQSLKHPKGYLFTLWCFILAILQAAFLLEKSDGSWYQFTGFLAAAGLGFVGVAPAFKGFIDERKVHRIGAGFAALFSLIYTIAAGYSYCTALFAVLLVTLIFAYCIDPDKRFKNVIYLAEVCCFSNLYLVELIIL